MDIINSEQDKKIDSKVPWTIFIWAISIIIITGGIIVNYAVGANAKAENAIQQTSEVQGDIKAINANIGGIQSSVTRIETKVDRIR